MKHLCIIILSLSASCAFMQHRELIEITHFGPRATLDSLGTFSEDSCYKQREILNGADEREAHRYTPNKLPLWDIVRLCVQPGVYPDLQVNPAE